MKEKRSKAPKIIGTLFLVLILGAFVGLYAWMATPVSYKTTFTAEGKNVAEVSIEGIMFKLPDSPEDAPRILIGSYATKAGSKTTSGIIVNGVEIKLPEAPDKAEHGFAGWCFKDTALNADFFLNKAGIKDVKVYAKYVPYPRASFIVDGEEVYDLSVSGKEIVLPKADDKDEEVFDGWYINGEKLTEDYFVKNPIDEDVEVHAQYRPRARAFFVADGVQVSDIAIKGDVIELPEAPYKAGGYAFVGWYVMMGAEELEVTEDFFVNRQVESDLSILAKYEKFYVANFVDNEDNPIGEGIVINGEKIELPTPEVKDGYDFVGWYTNTNKGKEAVDEDFFVDRRITDDVVIYAEYERYYRVTLVVDDEVVDVIRITGDPISLPKMEKFVGETFFAGWFTEWGTRITEDYFVNNSVSDDVRVSAVYRDCYRVRFYAEGQAAPVADYAITDEQIIIPEADEKTDHFFVGWYATNGAQITEDYFVRNDAMSDVNVYTRYKHNFEFMITSANGCSVIKLNNKSADSIEVPSSYVINVNGVDKTYIVEGIYPNAFAGAENLKNIILPDGVTTISAGAFAGCSALESIRIPGGATYDANGTSGSSIFGNVDSLVSVIAPIWVMDFVDMNVVQTVTLNGGEEIGAELFANAKALSEITLCDTLVTIGNRAFFGCDKIESISIPKNVSSIAKDAFAYCSALNSITVDSANASYEDGASDCIVEKAEMNLILGCKSSVIYEGIKKIDEFAFAGAYGVTAVNIPSSVEQISETAFCGCTAIESVSVDASNTVYKALSECIVKGERVILGSAEANVLDESIKEISEYAFSLNSKLSAIVINKNIANLSENTFAGCTALQKVVIENPDITIDAAAFSGCANITEIVLDKGVAASEYSKMFDDITVAAGVTTVSGSLEFVGYAISKWNATLSDVTVIDGVEISDGFFVSCGNLEFVTLPASVTKIGAGVFANLAKLKTVEIDGVCAVAEIGDDAFSGCSSFVGLIADGADVDTKGLVIPASVTTIGKHAFYATAIKAVSFADGANTPTLAYEVFGACASLEAVNIPERITFVNRDAFLGSVEALKSAVVPANVLRCLAGAKALEELSVIGGDKIESYAIRGVESLKSIHIGQSITYIDVRAFEGCKNVESLTVDALNSVYFADANCIVKGDVIVLGCKGSDISAVEGAKEIGSYAFSGSAIESVTISANINKVDAFAFCDCRELETLVIEDSSVTVVDDVAFDGCNKIG